MELGRIYIATCSVNLKSYIGQTVHSLDKRRIGHHQNARAGSPAHFQRALRKHGEDAFEWRILEDNIPVARLDDREGLWVDFYDTHNNGYNSRDPGNQARGYKHTEEAKAKIAAAQKRRADIGEHHLLSEENLTRMRENNPMQDPEIRARATASLKARAARGEHNMQDPEVAARQGAAISATLAKKKRESQREAGQQFLFEEGD